MNNVRSTSPEWMETFPHFSRGWKLKDALETLQNDPSRAPQEPLVGRAFNYFPKDRQFEAFFTDNVKLQVIEAAYSDIDAHGDIQLRNFSLENLSIPELVLLYRILHSYQEHPHAVGRKIILAHLFLIEMKIQGLATAHRQEIMSAIQEANDRSANVLQFKALHPPKTHQDAMAESPASKLGDDHWIQVFEYLDPEHHGAAKRVCRYWNAVLNGEFFALECKKRLQNSALVGSGFFSSYRMTKILDSDFPAQIRIGIAYGLYTKALRSLSGSSKEEHPQILSKSDIKEQDDFFRCNAFVAFTLALPLELRPHALLEPLETASDPKSRVEHARHVRNALAASHAVRDLTTLALSNQIFGRNVVLLPEAIKFFTSLRTLTVTHVHLPALPKGISHLRNLEELKLNDNDISSIPEGFGSLSKLTNLDLSNNHLSSLPDEFENLSNLRVLNLGNNRLSSLPKNLFSSCTQLETVHLDKNKLVSLPSGAENLVNLGWLTVDHNELSSLPDGLFSHCEKLRSINLSFNHLVFLPERIGNLVDLHTFIASHNQIAFLPDAFVNLRNVRDLCLDHNKLASLPEGFEKLKSLKVLELGDNAFPAVPKCLAAFENLLRLGIKNNPFQYSSKEELIAFFPNFSTIKYLVYQKGDEYIV